MRTNDLQIFAFESEALQKCKEFIGAYAKSFAAGNNTTFWVVCKDSFNRVLFLRDNGEFE